MTHYLLTLVTSNVRGCSALFYPSLWEPHYLYSDLLDLDVYPDGVMWLSEFLHMFTLQNLAVSESKDV